MATAKLLFLSATLLVCAVAAVDKSTTNVTPSRTVVPHSTTTTNGPAPTTTPKPPAVAQYNYSNTTNASFPCRIRLNGTMAWNFTYNTAKNTATNVTELVDGTAKVVNDSSSCINRESAKLVLTWNGTNKEPRLLTFKFTARNVKRNMNWKLENVTLVFNVTETAFPGYPPHYSTNGTLYSEKLIDSDVEYQRSYLCSSSRVLNFKNMTDIALNVSLNITNFRIQAFDFKEPNSTENAFGNARVCSTDATGKTIVPIAVGIALGVLVIAVIVAFIISKIVNRKKSGYEALN